MSDIYLSPFRISVRQNSTIWARQKSTLKCYQDNDITNRKKVNKCTHFFDIANGKLFETQILLNSNKQLDCPQNSK